MNKKRNIDGFSHDSYAWNFRKVIGVLCYKVFFTITTKTVAGLVICNLILVGQYLHYIELLYVAPLGLEESDASSFISFLPFFHFTASILCQFFNWLTSYFV